MCFLPCRRYQHLDLAKRYFIKPVQLRVVKLPGFAVFEVGVKFVRSVERSQRIGPSDQKDRGRHLATRLLKH